MLRAPVYIGERAVVEAGAVIEAGSVIDRRALVEEGCRVSGSVLLEGARLGRGGRLTGALLCAGSAVKAGGALFEGAVLGERAVLGAHGAIKAGVRVWPEKTLPDGVQVESHLKTGSPARGVFDDDGIFGELGVELTPEFLRAAGRGARQLRSAGAGGCGNSGGATAQALAAALRAGVQSTGATVVEFGEEFGSMFEFFLTYCAFPLGVYLDCGNGNETRIRVFCEGAMPPTRELERTVEGAFARGNLYAPAALVGD